MTAPESVIASFRNVLRARERGHFDAILSGALQQGQVCLGLGLGLDEKTAIMVAAGFVDGCLFAARRADDHSVVVAANAVADALEARLRAFAESRGKA